jgi:hypothetical protein
MNSCIEGPPLKSFLTAALFLITACGVGSGQSEPQSLAEVAKQNKHDNQDKKGVVVLTEDDISSAHGVISVVGDESVRVAGPGTASPQKTAVVKENAAPSGSNTRVAELKKKLESYKAEQQSWKDSAKRYEDLLANTTDDFRRASYQELLDNDKKSVVNLQQKIDQVSADLSKAQQAAAASQSTAGSKPASAPPTASTQ